MASYGVLVVVGKVPALRAAGSLQLQDSSLKYRAAGLEVIITIFTVMCLSNI